jgi:hypothetical protein
MLVRIITLSPVESRKTVKDTVFNGKGITGLLCLLREHDGSERNGPLWMHVLPQRWLSSYLPISHLGWFRF